MGTTRCTRFSGRVQTGYNAVVPIFPGEISPQSALYPTFCRRKEVHRRCTLLSGHRKTGYNAYYPTFYDRKIENGRHSGISGRGFYGYNALYLVSRVPEKRVQRRCTSFNLLRFRGEGREFAKTMASNGCLKENFPSNVCLRIVGRIREI